VRVAGADHFPVAGHWLDDFHVTASFLWYGGDLPLDLVRFERSASSPSLRALADHVEGIAHLDLDLLVLGRVSIQSSPMSCWLPEVSAL